MEWQSFASGNGGNFVSASPITSRVDFLPTYPYPPSYPPEMIAACFPIKRKVIFGKVKSKLGLDDSQLKSTDQAYSVNKLDITELDQIGSKNWKKRPDYISEIRNCQNCVFLKKFVNLCGNKLPKRAKSTPKCKKIYTNRGRLRSVLEYDSNKRFHKNLLNFVTFDAGNCWPECFFQFWIFTSGIFFGVSRFVDILKVCFEGNTFWKLLETSSTEIILALVILALFHNFWLFPKNLR